MIEWMGRILIVGGVFISIAGLLLVFGSKMPFFGKLPGDILIKKDNFTFYFPLTTSIIISIILTILLNIIFRR